MLATCASESAQKDIDLDVDRHFLVHYALISPSNSQRKWQAADGSKPPISQDKIQLITRPAQRPSPSSPVRSSLPRVRVIVCTMLIPSESSPYYLPNAATASAPIPPSLSGSSILLLESKSEFCPRISSQKCKSPVLKSSPSPTYAHQDP